MELLELRGLRRHDVVARPRGRQRRRVELDEVAARIKGREGRGLGQEPHGVEGLGLVCHSVLFVVWGSLTTCGALGDERWRSWGSDVRAEAVPTRLFQRWQLSRPVNSSVFVR